MWKISLLLLSSLFLLCSCAGKTKEAAKASETVQSRVIERGSLEAEALVLAADSVSEVITARESDGERVTVIERKIFAPAAVRVHEKRDTLTVRDSVYFRDTVYVSERSEPAGSGFKLRHVIVSVVIVVLIYSYFHRRLK
jgi:hypothetical protein